MEFKQLQSFSAVVKYQSFTKAAERLYLSQPTISTHIRLLEEELNSTLIVRTTKSVEVTPRGRELYECAATILGLRDNLIQRWSDAENKVVQLGASTIPSAYLLPEILPEYGNEHPGTYFTIHQSDSQGIVDGLLNGSFDIGMIGMNCEDESLTCIPFYQDRMVLITPVNEYFQVLKKQEAVPLQQLLREPMILREQGSGSKKSAERFLDSVHIREENLRVTARINDQESIKNLVAGGLGVSIISERAAHNFVEAKRLLMFELPEGSSGRNFYLAFRKNYILKEYVLDFLNYVKRHYTHSP
ncbi:LysR substrate binding domain protein [uncultured Eubacteriales bacterium]|uniref:LysR substrate binding domain protein n=1 Tax=uncultured Eubacteriales bacterium TaxID=172733 RepID=A0A212JCT3_9FIRM|nr:LysR substrate binding domain protein [uncultured Eubacteriales bacterium]